MTVKGIATYNTVATPSTIPLYEGREEGGRGGGREGGRERGREEGRERERGRGGGREGGRERGREEGEREGGEMVNIGQNTETHRSLLNSCPRTLRTEKRRAATTAVCMPGKKRDRPHPLICMHACMHQ